jgi:hypothetical protein
MSHAQLCVGEDAKEEWADGNGDENGEEVGDGVWREDEEKPEGGIVKRRNQAAEVGEE